MNAALEALTQALTILQQATALDLLGDHESAVEMYDAAKSELDNLAPYLPREHADVVRRYGVEIKRRIDAIKRDRWMKERKSEFPSFSVEYLPNTVPVEDFKVPVNPTFRVFWLMRLLQRSMRQGAFVAPDLFVGKEVWYQIGGAAALSHTGPKIRYLTVICEAMDILRGVTDLSNVALVNKSLQKFLKVVEEAKLNLKAEMGIRGEGSGSRSMIERGMRGLFQKGQQVLRTWMNQESNIELYLIWAINTLEQAQIFERWITYYFPMPKSPVIAEVIGFLQRVVTLLYIAPCTFLLRDMTILVERFQEKCRRSTTRIFPVDVKLESTSS